MKTQWRVFRFLILPVHGLEKGFVGRALTLCRPLLICLPAMWFGVKLLNLWMFLHILISTYFLIIIIMIIIIIIIAILLDVKWYPIVVLICISSMRNDVEYFLTGMLVIFVSSLEKFLMENLWCHALWLGLYLVHSGDLFTMGTSWSDLNFREIKVTPRWRTICGE